LRPFFSFIYKHLRLFEQLLNSLTVSLLLLAVLYGWMNLSFSFIFEKEVAKLTAKITHIFLSEKKQPYSLSEKNQPYTFSEKNQPYTLKDAMYIDVAQSLTLVQDKFGPHVIPDRAKLDTLFQLLYNYTDTGKIIICDLYFDVRSDQDSALELSMSRFPHLLSTVKTNSLQEIAPNVIRAGKSATSGFHSQREPFLIFSNALFKFNLTDKNCIQTLPLLIYQQVNHHGIFCLGNTLHIGNEWYLNTVLINERLGLNVTKAEYEDQVIPIAQVINDLKGKTGSYRHALGRKKFILIGNFQEDLHKTIFGERPGPMIIFDLYISLEQKHNMISTAWLLSAVLFLSILIFNDLYPIAILKHYVNWLSKKSRLLGLKRVPDFDWLIFYLFVIASDIFFKVHLEAVADIVFLYLSTWAWKYFRTRYNKLLQLHRMGKRVGARTVFYYLFKKMASEGKV